MRPKLFIASSIENKSIAMAAQANLENDVEVTVWTQGIFDPSKYFMESLIDVLNSSHYGLFVFAPDDITRLRGTDYQTARDNVVLELGLFIGRLGRDRVFFLIPRNATDFHLPTDLLGITPLTYDDSREDGNLRAALGPACESISSATKKLDLSENRQIPLDSDIQAGIIAFHKNRGTEPHLIDRYLPEAKDEIAIMAVQFNSIVHQYLGELAQVASRGCQVKILMMSPKDAGGNDNPNVESYQSQRTYTKLLSRLEIATDSFKKWLDSLDSEVRKNVEIRQYLEHPTVSMFFVDKENDEGFLRVEVLPYKAHAHEFPNYQLLRKGDPEFFDFHKRSFNLLWEKSIVL